MRLGLVGKELAHSYSRDFFNRKFERDGLNASYDLLEMESLAQLRSRVESMELDGFNVTIPYKVEVMQLLDAVREDARQIGAVNCIRVENGVWTGHNTDYVAFAESLRPYLPGIRSALILGTGGASRAVAYALEQLGIEHTHVSRSGEHDYRHLQAKDIAANQLIVHTTPLGMNNEIGNAPAIPYDALTSDHLVYDLVYNPSKTLFLQLAEYHGAMIMNGAEMLKRQAQLSWLIWNNGSTTSA